MPRAFFSLLFASQNDKKNEQIPKMHARHLEVIIRLLQSPSAAVFDVAMNYSSAGKEMNNSLKEIFSLFTPVVLVSLGEEMNAVRI